MKYKNTYTLGCAIFYENCVFNGHRVEFSSIWCREVVRNRWTGTQESPFWWVTIITSFEGPKFRLLKIVHKTCYFSSNLAIFDKKILLQFRHYQSIGTKLCTPSLHTKCETKILPRAHRFCLGFCIFCKISHTLVWPSHNLGFITNDAELGH